MTTCPKCQAKIELEDKNCPQCGAEIDNSGTLDVSFSSDFDEDHAGPEAEDADLDEVISDEEDSSTREVDPAIAAELKDSQPNVDPRGSTKSVDEELLGWDGEDDPTEMDQDSTESADYHHDQDQYVPTISIDEPGEKPIGLDIPEREIVAPGNEPDDEFDYQLKKEIGKGAVGIVYSATQASLDREVAIKMLAKQKIKGKKQEITSLSERDIQKFLSEAQITAKLDHPNIITVHDIGLTRNETLFYSMKLMKGKGWNETLHDSSLRENLEIFDNVCDAVRLAHSQGVIHRDLKPQNVLVGEFGEVQVSDWGMAIELSSINGSPISGGGTPSYMAPEMALHYLAQNKKKLLVKKLETAPDSEKAGLNKQIRQLQGQETKWKKVIGTTSDVYLLGSILFEIAVGYAPHRFQSQSKKSELGTRYSGYKSMKELQRAANHSIADYRIPPRPDQIARDALKMIALKAIAFEPEDRFRTVEEFKESITQFRDLIRSIELSEEGKKQLELADKNKQSYQNLANASFAYEEALKLWSDNEDAKAGRAESIMRYAERAQEKKDYELGLSLLTDDAIKMQPTEKPAVGLKKELSTQKKRRDNRQRAFWIATAVAALLIAGAIPVIYFAQKAVSDSETAKKLSDEAVAQADVEKAQAKKETDAAAKATEKANIDVAKAAAATEKAGQDTEKARQSVEAAERQTAEANIQTLEAEWTTIVAEEDAEIAAANAEESLEAQRNAEQLADKAKEDQRKLTVLNKFKEFEIARRQEEVQFSELISGIAGIRGAIENREASEANLRIRELFANKSIPLKMKNSWELHHLYGRANLDGDIFNGTLSDNQSFTVVRSSADGNVMIGLTTDNQFHVLKRDAENMVSPLELPNLLPADVMSMAVSDDGKWMAFVQNGNQLSAENRAPVIYDVENSKQISINQQSLEDQLTFSSTSFKGDLIPEKFFFGGQHLQIFPSGESLQLFVVDQRVELGVNQFRCVLAKLTKQTNSETGGEEFVIAEDADVKKLKLVGRPLVSSTNLPTNAGCLVSAIRDETGLKIALVCGYPTLRMETGLMVFDFEKAVEATETERQRYASTTVDAESDATGPIKKNAFFKALRAESADLDFDPTSLLLHNGVAYVGTSDGRIVRYNCQPGEIACKLTRSQLTDAGQMTHKSAVRKMQVVEVNQQQRLYSTSGNEVFIWSGKENLEPRPLFGHQGPIVDMNVVNVNGKPEIVTVSSQNKLAEMRVWNANPKALDHTPEKELRLNSKKEVVRGTTDLLPGSNAVAVAYSDGSLNYWDPETGEINIPNPSQSTTLSANDWRRGQFGFFENRLVTMYSNQRGLLVWDLDDLTKTKPQLFSSASPTPSSAYVGTENESTNPETHFSATADGKLIFTSHPTQPNKILAWQRAGEDAKYQSTDIGPFSKQAPGSGEGNTKRQLNNETTAEPFVSPDGMWTAIIVRLKYTYQLQVYRTKDLLQETFSPVFVSQTPSNTAFQHLAFFGDGNLIVGHLQSSTQLQKDSESNKPVNRRALGLFQVSQSNGSWDRQEVSFPENLEDRYDGGLSLNDFVSINGERYFVGVGAIRKQKDESTAKEKVTQQDDFDWEVVRWKTDGTYQSQPLTRFSSRINPRFKGTDVVYMTQDRSKSKLESMQLNRWSLDGNTQPMTITNPDARSIVNRWNPVGDEHFVYGGSQWFTVEGFDKAAETYTRFDFSYANAVEELFLYDRSILVRHADGAVNLLNIDKPKEPIQLDGRHEKISLSTDGTQIAMRPATSQVIQVTSVEKVLGGDKKVVEIDLTPPGAEDALLGFNWLTESASAQIGNPATGNPSQLVSLRKIDGKLVMEFWNPVTKASVGSAQTLGGEVHGDVRDFQLAPQSARIATVLWDSQDIPLSVWTFGWADAPDNEEGADNPAKVAAWAKVTTNLNGNEVYDIHFSEVVQSSIEDVASRIVIATGDSAEIFLIQKIDSSVENMDEIYSLTSVYKVPSRGFRNAPLNARFSGDGKTLGTMTKNNVRVWLTDGWNDEGLAKADSDKSATDQDYLFTDSEFEILKEAGVAKELDEDQVIQLFTNEQLESFSDEQIQLLRDRKLIPSKQDPQQ